MSTRKVQIGFSLDELAERLRPALSLPADARVTSLVWGQAEDKHGRFHDVWWVSVESQEFPEVEFRIPRVMAGELAAPARKHLRKPPQPQIAARPARRRTG